MSNASEYRPQVMCPECGASNDLGRPFCKQCGTRLFEGSGPAKVKKPKKVGTPRNAVLSMVISLVVLWVLISGALVLWPFPLIGAEGSPAQGQEMARILTSMNRSVREGRYLPAQAISEGQFNAYAVAQAGPGQEMRANVEPGRIEVVAAESFFGLTITNRAVFERPSLEDPFTLVSLWWGHLPLPKGMAGFISRTVAARFDLEVESALLDEAVIENAERGRAVIGLR